MANVPCVILYEARLMEEVDSFRRTGSDETAANIHRVLEQRLN